MATATDDEPPTIVRSSADHETMPVIREIASIEMPIEKSMPMIFDVRHGVTGMTVTNGTRSISSLIVAAAPSRTMTAPDATTISAVPPVRTVDIETMDQVETVLAVGVMAGVMIDSPKGIGIALTEVTNSPALLIAHLIVTAVGLTSDETDGGDRVMTVTNNLPIMVATAITAITMANDMNSRVVHEIISHDLTDTSATMSDIITAMQNSRPVAVTMDIIRFLDTIADSSRSTDVTVTDHIMNSRAVMEGVTDITSRATDAPVGVDTISLGEQTGGLLAGKVDRGIRRPSRRSIRTPMARSPRTKSSPRSRLSTRTMTAR